MRKMQLVLLTPPDEFASMVIQTMKQSGFQGSVQYDSDLFTLRFEDGYLFLLKNLHIEYREEGVESQSGFLWQRVQGVMARGSMPSRFAEARENLVPRIRDEFSAPTFNLFLRSYGEEPVRDCSCIYANGLTIELCWDGPYNIHTIQQRKTMERWGVDWSSAISIAKENLRDFSGKQFSKPHAGVFPSPYGDNHDASRIVLTEEIMSMKTDGWPVALIPNRDTLLITGEYDNAGLIFAAKEALKLFETRTRRVSGTAYRLEAGHWFPFMPVDGSDAYPLFRELSVRKVSQVSDFPSVGKGQAMLGIEVRLKSSPDCICATGQAAFRVTIIWDGWGGVQMQYSAHPYRGPAEEAMPLSSLVACA